MGRLSELGLKPEPVVEVPAPQDPVVVPMPEPVPAALAPVRKDLEFQRDPGTGLIEKAIGYDAEGRKVEFDFVRDGRRRLEKIKVK